MALALVALGSNVGNRLSWLESAVAKLRSLGGLEVIAVSTWRESAPAGGPASQSAYLNGCAVVQTALPPEALLAEMQRIENDLGRTRDRPWGPRTIDLDLLLYDDLRILSPALTIPHPRMAWRRFVIDPAAEIARSMRHPSLGWTIEQLHEHLTQTPFYIAIAGPIAAGKTTLARAMVARHDRAFQDSAFHDGVFIGERFAPEQLEAFYADPPSQAWRIELEFLSQRSVDLDCNRALWNDRSRAIVGDYWFDQSLAFARVWLPQEKQAEYYELWKKFRMQVVRPRLTVMVDLPNETLLERIRARLRAGEEVLDATRLDALRNSLQRQATEPDVGPVMQLTYNDRGNWERELSAAIVAMT